MSLRQLLKKLIRRWAFHPLLVLRASRRWRSQHTGWRIQLEQWKEVWDMEVEWEIFFSPRVLILGLLQNPRSLLVDSILRRNQFECLCNSDPDCQREALDTVINLTKDIVGDWDWMLGILRNLKSFSIAFIGHLEIDTGVWTPQANSRRLATRGQ